MIITDLFELPVDKTYYRNGDDISLFKFGDKYKIVNSSNRLYLLEINDSIKFDKGLKKLGYKEDIFKC